jgi:hypothetical protein
VTFGEETALLEASMAAYDAPFDAGLATDLVSIRNLQVIPWLAVFAERQPELAARAKARLAQLPD